MQSIMLDPMGGIQRWIWYYVCIQSCKLAETIARGICGKRIWSRIES